MGLSFPKAEIWLVPSEGLNLATAAAQLVSITAPRCRGGAFSTVISPRVAAQAARSVPATMRSGLGR
jgi:hypothetical protein